MAELLITAQHNTSHYRSPDLLISLEALQHFHGYKISQLMDEEICHYLARSPARNLYELMTYIYDYGSTQPMRFAIKHRAFGLIGVISFGCIHKQPLEAVIGYWIGKPFQGMGYAKQAITAVIYILKKIKVGRVLAETFPANTKSENLLLRLGFRCVDRSMLHNGQIQYYLDVRAHKDPPAY